MGRIISIASAVPKFKVGQKEAKKIVQNLFAGSELDIQRLLPIFDNTQIEERYISVPPGWFVKQHSFAEKNDLYKKTAIDLAEKTINSILEQVDIQPEKIGHIFFVSSTGISTPSIDAYLFNLFKFRKNIKRTPIWGLGCAGGVAGIIRAYDWLKAYPEEAALVISVELCSLTYIKNDLSKSNFVATSLFGDGCGGALLVGAKNSCRLDRMLEIKDSEVITWEDSLDVMGWELNNNGLKVLFSQNIPAIVNKTAKPSISAFLEKNKLELESIDHFLSHPGGAKVIQAYQQALDFDEKKLFSMREVLKNYGNMSSATVFFVLQHYLNSSNYNRSDTILSAALGPGFSSEMFLAGVC